MGGRRQGGQLPSFGYKGQGNPETVKQWVVVEKEPFASPGPLPASETSPFSLPASSQH